MTSFISNRLRNYHKPEILSGLLYYTISGLAALALTSCGGGGGGGGGGSTAVTITSISRPGIVQATPYRLSIYGTNITSSMTLSITSGNPPVTIATITPTFFDSGLITANTNITSAPTESYVTINVLSNGTSVASTTMGVASTNQTVANGIQTIFTAKCAICHASGGAVGGLDLSDATIGNSTGVIGKTSIACSQKLRTVPGDPRRTSSVLIDRILPAPASQTCNQGHPMPPTGSTTTLTSQDIIDLTEWVAGGTR